MSQGELVIALEAYTWSFYASTTQINLKVNDDIL